MTMNNNCKKWYGTEHEFDKWKITEEVNLVKTTNQAIVGKSILQRRICKKCGYTEIDCQKEYFI